MAETKAEKAQRQRKKDGLPDKYYGRGGDDAFTEQMAAEYLAELRDRYKNLPSGDLRGAPDRMRADSQREPRSTWDQTALVYTAEKGPTSKTWEKVDENLNFLRQMARQAHRRDMLGEDSLTKIGTALLERSDGTTRAVFGFTTPVWPGETSQAARADRLERCELFFQKFGFPMPNFEDTKISRKGTCVEMWTFDRLLAGEERALVGRLTTVTGKLAEGGFAPLLMCPNCQKYAAALRQVFPHLEIVDKGVH